MFSCVTTALHHGCHLAPQQTVSQLAIPDFAPAKLRKNSTPLWACGVRPALPARASKTLSAA